MSASPSKKHVDYFGSSGLLSPGRAQQSVSQYEQSARPALGGMPSARRGSTASVASSIGGSLDTAGESVNQPVNDLAQNAISTLLSPPIVRTGLIPHTALPVSSAHRAPSSRDIPPVTLTSIPHVESAAFRPYLTVVGPLYENYQRAKFASEEIALTFSPNDAGNEDVSSYFTSRRRDTLNSRPSLSHMSSSSTLKTPSSPLAQRRAPGHPGQQRRNNTAPTSLSTIPTVYFEEKFQLENPRTFDIVSEKSDVIPPPPHGAREEGTAANGSIKPSVNTGRKALHTNAMLQEKLSWYMDTVEVHLITSIATASSSFFAALGSLKELQSEASESISRIQALRAALNRLDTEMASGGLEVLNMKRRRENLRKLGRAVDQICDVIEMANECEELVEKNELGNASNRLEELEALIAGGLSSSDQSKSRIDLRQMTALGEVSAGISELRLRISKGFETQFIEALLSDLRQHVESAPKRETLQRWASATMRVRGDHTRTKSSVPVYMKTNDQLRPSLLAALAGLGGQGQAVRAASAYRDAVLREIKSLIRRQLPSSSDDDVESVTSVSTRGGRRLNRQEKSSILSRNLRALDPEAAEELLVNIYTAVGEALRRLGVQVKVLLDVTSTIEEAPSPAKSKSPPPRSSSLAPDSPSRRIPVIQPVQEDVMQVLDLSSLLGQAVDVVQSQVTKVLRTRMEQTTRLSLQEFLRYFMLNRLFADECEAVSGRAGETLKEVVNSQVKEFLQVMSENEKQRSRATLDAEKWEAKDVGGAEKAVLSRILESMNTTPKAWMEFTRLWDDSFATTTANGDALSTEKVVRGAVIDEQKYILVGSAATALAALDRFCNLMAGIPSLTPEVANKMLDFLKSFNSRFVQLVLGAGALQSAGLKNITTKHLALASQMCSFIVALMPYLREFARRQAPSTLATVLPEFEKVKRLFQDHQSSLHDKLLDIMCQRCRTHASAVRRVDWDQNPSNSQPDGTTPPTTSPAIEALVRETTTLSKVLSRHLPEMEVQMILAPIFSHYKTEWTKVFTDATVKSEAGKARLLADAEFLMLRLGKIEAQARAGQELGEELMRIVKSKDVTASNDEVAPKPTTTTTATTTTTNSSGKEKEKEKVLASAEAGPGPGPGPVSSSSTLAVPAPSAATKHEVKSSIEIIASGAVQAQAAPSAPLSSPSAAAAAAAMSTPPSNDDDDAAAASSATSSTGTPDGTATITTTGSGGGDDEHAKNEADP